MKIVSYEIKLKEGKSLIDLELRLIKSLEWHISKHNDRTYLLDKATNSITVKILKLEECIN